MGTLVVSFGHGAVGGFSIGPEDLRLQQMLKYRPPSGFAERYALFIKLLESTEAGVRSKALYRWHRGRGEWRRLKG